MVVRGLTAFAIGAAMQVALFGPALAQGSASSPGRAGPGPAYGTSVQEQLGELAAPEASPAADLPVLYITSVEVLRTSAEPRLDVVRVTGLAASQGWSAPQLVPTYAGKPADGIVDLQFIATPPELSQSAEGFVPVDAVFPLEEGHPFNGVRVRAAENAIVVKQIPGSSQATISINDCRDCVGKKLVSEGATQPGQQGSIRQEDLPKLLRVVRPSDGIRGAKLNPNRLTLILGDDGTIVAAFWE